MRLLLPIALGCVLGAAAWSCSGDEDGAHGGGQAGSAQGGTAGDGSGATSGTGVGGTGAAAGTAGAGGTGAVAGAGGGGAQAGTAGTSAGGAGTGGVSGSGGTGGSGGSFSGTVRFVALGDTGEGSDTQKKVAAAIATVCAQKGCDFAQLLGDNFYENGVGSVTDGLWQSHFEEPYAGVNLPFWVVLGNHDNGGNGTGNEPARGDFQVAYAQTSTKWKMPARVYAHAEGPAEFFALDTNQGMFAQHQAQQAEVASWTQGSAAPWKIAFGHHPYLSNGPHGNAGSYEGLPFIPLVNGAGVKELLDGAVCGKVDVYICGHDHSKQWLVDKCGGTTELIVSGAGAKSTELKGSNATHFEDLLEGFLWAEISGNTFVGEFYDADGVMQFTRTITK